MGTNIVDECGYLRRGKVWVLRPAMDIVETFMSSYISSFLNSFNSSVASIPN
jgi:hypothetical protein